MCAFRLVYACVVVVVYTTHTHTAHTNFFLVDLMMMRER